MTRHFLQLCSKYEVLLLIRESSADVITVSGFSCQSTHANSHSMPLTDLCIVMPIRILRKCKCATTLPYLRRCSLFCFNTAAKAEPLTLPRVRLQPRECISEPNSKPIYCHNNTFTVLLAPVSFSIASYWLKKKKLCVLALLFPEL